MNFQGNESKAGFEDCVTIKQTKLQGRFTVANRDIEPGELLAVDQPFVKHLDKEHTKTHCWHCLANTQFLPIFACPNCSGVLFCSETCRTIATETYHKFECGFTDVLYQADVGVWILAYRIVSSYQKDFFLQNLHVEDENFGDFCKLVAHYGSEKFTPPELMKEALICVFLTRCLQATGYFGNLQSSESDFGFEELSVSMWIHKCMRISRFNCHAIREVKKVKCGFFPNLLGLTDRLNYSELYKH